MDKYNKQIERNKSKQQEYRQKKKQKGEKHYSFYYNQREFDIIIKKVGVEPTPLALVNFVRAEIVKSVIAYNEQVANEANDHE